jgi:diguanylate cyclase (GGDEF)-like protein/PAS domain S-box-containing protein/hemerythrin-like metal-binding protein
MTENPPTIAAALGSPGAAAAADGIPGEHERLLALIVRLRELRGGPAEAVAAALAEAQQFARAHAQSEEAAMAAVSYPALDEHRAAHENIARRLNQCAAQARAGDPRSADAAARLLQSWLDQHLPAHDHRFHEYLVSLVLRRLRDGNLGDAAAEAEQQRFRAILEAAPNALLVVDHAGRITLVNTQLERLYGYHRDELLGQPVELLIPERHRPAHGQLRQGFLASPEGRAMGGGRELYGRRKDGSEVPVEIGLSPLRTAEGRFVLASIINISKRKEAEALLRAAEADALRDSILRSLPVSVVACDPAGTIVSVNPAAERLLGYRREELLGQDVMLIHDGAEIERRAVELSRHLGQAIPAGFQVLVASGSRDNPDNREWTYRRKDGTALPVQIAVTALRDNRDKIIGFVKVATDITARKRAEDSVRYMANHDALTGLPNRTLLGERLHMAVLQARRGPGMGAVFLLDLDQFKQINDSLGHQVGDELLVAMSNRLQDCMREVDTVARLGGDEFVIIVGEVQAAEDLNPLIEKIQQAVARPLTVRGHELHVSTSIGGCLFPRDGEDEATLLKKADAAMYRAKAGARGSFRWFSEEMMRESQEQLAMGTALRQAIALGEIGVHFQPKISLRNGQITGTEALMRWRRGLKDYVPPARFIPIAEDTGQIVHLGEWVLRQACRECVRMQKELGRAVTVAVNVSARQLHERLWLPTVRSALEDSGLAPQHLELEITESVLMHNMDLNARLLAGLRDLGVCLSVDDFGTGYSSLSYLTRFPIDKIKIDQSFIRDLTIDTRDAAVVNAIIAMAKRLDIQVVAEGVETVEQQNHLIDEGCDEAQGFLYAAGLPPDDLLQRFDRIESAVVFDKSRGETAFKLSDWVETLVRNEKR